MYVRSTSGSCRNSAVIKCCVEQCYTDLDLVVLIDSSYSINNADKANFEKRVDAFFIFPISEHLFEYIGTQFPPPSAILYGKMSSITVLLFKKI